MIVTGHYGVKPPLPHHPGTEGLGIVDKLGEGVTNVAVGDRVTGGAGGAWSEYYLTHAAGLVVVPASIDDATACQLNTSLTRTCPLPGSDIATSSTRNTLPGLP